MSKLTEKDRRTVNNYVQHLIYKSVQCIVQSRRAAKQHTASKAAVADWFNLTICDLPDVQSEAKVLFGGDQVACLREPVCVEVSLRTSDNETMILEYWWLTNKLDGVGVSEIRSTSTVYMYSETLLKSLLTMSRATPAYRLARRQAPVGDYTVQCRLLCGEPSLGGADDYQTNVVGTVPWTQGTVVLSLAQKTRLHICPRKVPIPSSDVIITDGHYDIAGGFKHPHPYSLQQENVSVDSAAMNMDDMSSTMKPKRAAFASEADGGAGDICSDISADIPFASLLQCASPVPTAAAVVGTSRKNTQNIPTGDEKLSHDLRAKLDLSNESAESNQSREDFVLLELRAPFAGQEEDLGRFYRECQAAPALSMFEGNISDASATSDATRDAVSSITEQLAKFEANANEFTEFVNSLQEVDS